MIVLRRFPAVLAGILILLGGCRQPHEAEIDRLFEAFEGKNVPGASVMVIRDRKPAYVKAYGTVNLEKNIPAAPEANFRLASMTKQFTSMCILMLIDRGKLSFESTLKDVFPDFPAYGRTVTIHNLLQHTSGLISYESLMPETQTEQVLDRDVLRMMAAQDSTYFEPGTEYRYSNSGYSTLAMIVEKVSGTSFAGFLHDNIFAPLGMNNSVAYEKGISTVKNRAFGYALVDSSFVFSDQSSTSAVLGDGGIYTSVVDLFKWDQALYTDRLVSRELLEKAFTPGTLKDGSPLTYGYGWSIDEYNGVKRIGHGGATCGFRSVIHRYPDERFTVIILANRRVASVERLAGSVFDVFHGEGE